MYIPKRYGQSKIDNCPFCGKQATLLNSQGVPTCISHKEEQLENLKCACGSTLDLLTGKFGVFFSCMKCGNINFRKMLEFNVIKPKMSISSDKISNQAREIKSKFEPKTEQRIDPKSPYGGRKVTTIRSDDPRYFD